MRAKAESAHICIVQFLASSRKQLLHAAQWNFQAKIILFDTILSCNSDLRCRKRCFHPSERLLGKRVTHPCHNRYKLSHISVLRPYFPGGKLNGFPSAPPNLKDLMTHSLHHLLPGLTGYLIRVAPLAFAPHRRARSSKTPSLLVVLLGLQHFTATPKVPLASPASKPCSIFCTSCS